MKKVLFAAIAMMFVAFESFAQTEQGTFSIQPTVGMTVAKVNVSGASSKVGFVGGANFAYQANDWLALSAGLMFSMEGAKDDDVKLNANYLNVPILANFYVVEGLAIKTGIQPGFNLSSKIKTGGVSVDAEEVTKSCNFSVPFGVAYEFGQFVVDARYNIGVSNMYETQGLNSKGRVWQITIGYKIPLSR